jgi:hypothetical protein
VDFPGIGFWRRFNLDQIIEALIADKRTGRS